MQWRWEPVRSQTTAPRTANLRHRVVPPIWQYLRDILPCSSWLHHYPDFPQPQRYFVPHGFRHGDTLNSKMAWEEPRQTGMVYRRLGNSGLHVSALGLGGWITFGGQVEDGV